MKHSMMPTLLTGTLFVATLMGPHAASAAEYTVSQKDKAFSAAKLEVKMGDKIVFKNAEADREHNVYSISSGNAFELPSQAPGQANTLDIDPAKHKPGTMQVECAIHRGMKLTVDIKP